jgi:hypothetical protein
MSARVKKTSCPGCGAPVESRELETVFLGDVANRPLQMAKCIAVGVLVGVVFGVVLGAPLHRWPMAGPIVGSILGGLTASLLAKRYNERVRGKPVDWWPHSITCARCGRVFGRYEEGGDPPMSAWP